MTLAQLMMLIDVETAQQKPQQPAELSEWAELSPAAQSNGDGNKDKDQGDADAAITDAAVPGSARLLDDHHSLGRLAHGYKDEA